MHQHDIVIFWHGLVAQQPKPVHKRVCTWIDGQLQSNVFASQVPSGFLSNCMVKLQLIHIKHHFRVVLDARDKLCDN